MRKKQIMNEIKSFYQFLQRRQKECELCKDDGQDQQIQFNVTQIITELYGISFWKILDKK